jgi:hypothetical protein
MRLDNGAVYTRGEPEIVRIDDQPPQAASLARKPKAGWRWWNRKLNQGQGHLLEILDERGEV